MAADLFYREMTVVRNRRGLGKVLDFVREHAEGTPGTALRNRLLVGEILASTMLAREESRGTHFREDFPDRSSLWDRRLSILRGKDGMPSVQAGNVSGGWDDLDSASTE